MSEKIRIGKPGYAYSDTNIANIVFDSDINTFKIKTSAVLTLTPSAMSYTLNHALGYSPAFLLWFEVNGNGKWFPMATYEDQSGYGLDVVCTSDNNNLNISWTYDSLPSSLRAFYMLIVDPIN